MSGARTTPSMPPAQVHFLGHATVILDLDGVRLLTDPVLRPRIAGLVHRYPPSLQRDVDLHSIDAVLISHLHRDHLDLASLAMLPKGTPVLVPRHGARLLTDHEFTSAFEMEPGQSTRIGATDVMATPARHSGFRAPFGPVGGCIGFLVAGSQRIYFAGDTDVFAGMATEAPLDVALLPVGGWGPILGAGHMDPRGAVHALRLLRPRIAVPIHWGTLVPLGLHFRAWSYLTQPPLEFARLARQEAPHVRVCILHPGETLHVEPMTPEVREA